MPVAEVEASKLLIKVTQEWRPRETLFSNKTTLEAILPSHKNQSILIIDL
jgi:hypothetical protein